MKWFWKTRVNRTVQRKALYRPKLALESLEDRLTPSANPIAVPLLVAPSSVQSNLNVIYSDGNTPPAVQNSATYVTGTLGNATAEGVAVGTGAAAGTYVTGLVQAPGADQLAYVTKYSPTGAVVYAVTFAGFADPGSSTEGTGIAVDSSGNAYISGKAHHSTDSSDNGLYIKIDPAGATFVYAFIQGSGPTGGPVSTNGVAIDTAGDAVFVGQYSPSATENDLLAARFTPTGTATYGFFFTFGPGTASQGNGAAMPGSGVSTTIAGWVNLGGTADQDAGIVKLDAAGTPTAAATVASPGVDSLNAVTLDAAGNSYVAGTLDIGGPTQSGVVVKIDPTLATVIWTTAPVGASSTSLSANGIALDATGNVITTGADSSGTAYIAKLDGAAGAVSDYTAFGGTGGGDVGLAVAFRASDSSVFVAGTTNSADFPVTDGSTLNGTQDGFLANFTI